MKDDHATKDAGSMGLVNNCVWSGDCEVGVGVDDDCAWKTVGGAINNCVWTSDGDDDRARNEARNMVVE
ncbi:hypothetical protein BK120_31730 [Paenibacillus sp. FSL A5-0031]|nr:hypothetical protein BK120_31730 [Paenibacillus sp. FSL A5-0031]